MTNQHPITPPPELVRQWAQCNGEKDLERFWTRIATQAAQWGADTELKECVKLANEMLQDGNSLRVARRPKPPSLKEQALIMLRHLEGAAQDFMDTTEATTTIRRALEALPND